MKKRMIFGGYPYLASSWKNFLPNDCEQKIIPFADIVSQASKTNFREFAHIIFFSQSIGSVRPSKKVYSE